MQKFKFVAGFLISLEGIELIKNNSTNLKSITQRMTKVSRLNFEITDLLIPHVFPLPLNENGIKGIEEFLNVKSEKGIFELDEKMIDNLNEQFNQKDDFNLYQLVSLNVFTRYFNIIFVDKDLEFYNSGYDESLISIKTL